MQHTFLAAPPVIADTHPLLWLRMAASYPWLLIGTNAVRLISTVLALAILMLWTPSGVRCVLRRHAETIAARIAHKPLGLAMLAALLHPPREGDGRRAVYLPFATGVLVFHARWFLDGITELRRAQLAFVGQISIFLALAFAIYAHGKTYRDLTPGRAIAGMLLMLVAGVGAAAVMR